MGDGDKLSLSRFSSLKLGNLSLATFSGCQTGLGGGRDENGSEVAGLSYISQRNGANAVIASLWSVSDKSTSVLMAQIYKNKANKGESLGSALRRAKLDLLASKEYSHPFHWASFQLYGDWR